MSVIFPESLKSTSWEVCSAESSQLYVGSETTGMSDDSAEHTNQRVDWSDSGKISQVYGGISL